MILSLHLLNLQLVLQICHACVRDRPPLNSELLLVVFFADLRPSLVHLSFFQAKAVPILLCRTKFWLFQLHSSLPQATIWHSKRTPISKLRPYRYRIRLEYHLEVIDLLAPEAARFALLAVRAVLALLPNTLPKVLLPRILRNLLRAAIHLRCIVVILIFVFILRDRPIRQLLQRICLLLVFSDILFLIDVERVLEQFVELNWHLVC